MASPMIRSDSPPAYASALSKKFTPASYAAARQSSARLPASCGPNVTQDPKDRTLTFRPVPPRRRYSISMVTPLVLGGVFGADRANRPNPTGEPGVAVPRPDRAPPGVRCWPGERPARDPRTAVSAPVPGTRGPVAGGGVAHRIRAGRCRPRAPYGCRIRPGRPAAGHLRSGVRPRWSPGLRALRRDVAPLRQSRPAGDGHDPTAVVVGGQVDAQRRRRDGGGGRSARR